MHKVGSFGGFCKAHPTKKSLAVAIHDALDYIKYFPVDFIRLAPDLAQLGEGVLGGFW